MDHTTDNWAKNMKPVSKKAHKLEKDKRSVYYLIAPSYKNSVDYELNADIELGVKKYKPSQNERNQHLKSMISA